MTWIKNNRTHVAVAFLFVLVLIAVYSLCSCMGGLWKPDYSAAIGELLLVIVIALEGMVAVWELHRAKDDRKQENLTNIVAREAEHNWNIVGNPNCCRAVEQSQTLHFYESKSEQDQYWGARAVHLSHVLLLRQVWELYGSTEDPKHLDGWYQFACTTVRDLSTAVPEAVRTPYQWAAHDLWEHLSKQSEPVPGKFVEWLKLLGNKLNHDPMTRG